MVKGCVQLSLVPDINNSLKMCPVDHVALLGSLSTLLPPPAGDGTALQVVHVTGHPKIRFNDLFAALKTYGYAVDQVEYVQWRAKLEQHVIETQDNALFPLLHFVLDDLPTSTKSAELDDRNARALARRAGEPETSGVTEPLVGLYMAWLVRAGFLDAPTGANGAKALPTLQGGVQTAIGRTTAGK